MATLCAYVVVAYFTAVEGVGEGRAHGLPACITGVGWVGGVGAYIKMMVLRAHLL